MPTTRQTNGYSENARRTHARAIKEIYRKIEQVSGLEKTQLETPEPLKQTLSEAMSHALRSKDWQARKLYAFAEEPEGIDAAAHRYMMRYAEAFYLLEQMSKQQPTPSDDAQKQFYNGLFNRMNLVELYTSHITNDTQAELETLTHGDTANAISLHSFIIKHTIDQCRQLGMADARVNPSCMKRMPEDCAQEIKRYGTATADSLRKNFRFANQQQDLTYSARLAHESRQQSVER